jgi:uncharacterized membrane protein YphA (DoxX/SURF4 family)
LIGSFRNFLQPLLVALVLLILVIVVGPVLRLSATTVLTIVIGLILIGSLALAAYLARVCKRPLAAVGVILTAAAVWIAFYLTPAAAPWLVWTVLLFVGVGLIAYDASKDTARKGWWPFALLRIFFGWAWMDNAQDHFRVGNWFVGDGGGFAQTASGAAQRPPTFFLDALYQGFLRGAIVPGADSWAGVTACGELTFGLLLALGFATPVAVWLSLWQSGNYTLMKGFLSHGAYTDKVFFIADLSIMLTGAGRVYGVDAILQHHVPAWFATWFLGAPQAEAVPAESRVRGRVSPQPTG